MWDKNDWVYEENHGFGMEYSYENQVIIVCHDIAESLDEGIGIVAIVIDVSSGFHFISHDRLFTKLGFEGSRLGEGIPCRSYRKFQSKKAAIQGSHRNLKCAARERFGSTTVSSVRK